MKKIYKLILILIIIIMTGCSNQKEEKLKIVTVNFPSYDFARAITKDVKDAEVEMLLNPGEEVHTYDPSPKDIINIEKSDIFIYNGGESDEWVEKILKDINKNTKIIKMIDLVDVKEEEIVEGMQTKEEEIEYDEHVWTSPVNAIKIIENITSNIIQKDEKNREIYKKNSDNYIKKIKNIDDRIRRIVSTSKRKELIFADRFPLRYFTDEYNLNYYAAFKGCAEETEASAKTITFLINKVKEDKIPVVFKIELSNGKLANQISKETNTKVLEFNSAHNITKKDFESEKTYVDIMNDNVNAIKEALN